MNLAKLHMVNNQIKVIPMNPTEKYNVVSEELSNIFPRLNITIAVSTKYNFATIIGDGIKKTNVKSSYSMPINTVNNIKSIMNRPIIITDIKDGICQVNRTANIIVYVGDKIFRSKQITTDMIIAGCIHEVGHWVHLNPLIFNNIPPIVIKGIQLISTLYTIGVITTSGTIVGAIISIAVITTLHKLIAVYWFQKTELMCDEFVVRLGRGNDLKQLLSKLSTNKKNYKLPDDNKLIIYLKVIETYLKRTHPNLRTRHENIKRKTVKQSLPDNGRKLIPSIVSDVGMMYLKITYRGNIV